MKILIPISLGELYDKISILKVKVNRIQDKEKLKNIQKELDLLYKIASKHPIQTYFIIDLYNINDQIWVTEDNIRKKEQKKEYDEIFISLARDIYHNNDKRAEIKREINLKYGSDIIEEKSYEKYN
jgi:hypothetical protein